MPSAEWREALRLQPDDVDALDQLAWALATSPEASIRNGPEAVALARRAVQLGDGRDADLLATLAAAYAEAGRFSEAVETAERAISLASAPATPPRSMPSAPNSSSTEPAPPIANLTIGLPANQPMAIRSDDRLLQ